MKVPTGRVVGAFAVSLPRSPRMPDDVPLITQRPGGTMRTRHFAAATVALLALTACSSSEEDKPKAEAPAHKITKQDTRGNTRNIEVQVDSTTDLRAVFDHVVGSLDDEAGYFVYINCSTGGTARADNRLANGKYAKGNVGAATTGLKDRESEFSAVEGRKCPVDPADQAKQDAAREKAREAAGLPPSPAPLPRKAFIDGLNAVDPDIVHGKDDKAGSRGIDTCAIFKHFPGDRAKQIDQTNKRWISPTHPEGHGLATAEKILDLAHKHICPKF